MRLRSSVHTPLSGGLVMCLIAAFALGPGTGAGAAAPRPDMRISAISGKGSLGAGSRIAVTVTTTNAGTAGARASRTRLYLSRDGRRSTDDRRLPTARIPAVGRGKSVRTAIKAMVPATAPPMGRILACADDTRVVAEAREANNCRTTPDHDRDRY